MKSILSFFFLVFVLFCPLIAQQPAIPHQQWSTRFDVREYCDVLSLEKGFIDSTGSQYTYPDRYRLLHTSGSIGLDNGWQLWETGEERVVLFFKGTSPDPLSIVADLYCAMLPATGTAYVDGAEIPYQLADDERAGVHAGFLLGFLYLSQDVKPRLDSLYAKGHRDFLIAGHSQGGALTYYFTAWLHQLRKQGQYPEMNIKTYASASPKMGNMYFAYDLESKSGPDRLYSIINSEDIVPEMPITVQQLEQDMNKPNFLLYVYDKMDDLPFFQRIIFKRAFNRMRKSSIKSSDIYQKYLGGYSFKFIQSKRDVRVPEALGSTYFNRVGTPISLGMTGGYEAFLEQNTRYSHHSAESYQFKAAATMSVKPKTGSRQQ